MSEIADRERRGFWSSFQYVTIIGGQLQRAGPARRFCRPLLGEQAMQAWGWRIGFFAGARPCHRRVLHPARPRRDAQLRKCRGRSRNGADRRAHHLFREHPREAFLVMALTAGGTAAFYAYTIYMQKFLVNTSGFIARDARRRS